MKSLTAEMLISFNKLLHKHGVPQDSEKKLSSFLQHLSKSANNDLEFLAYLILYILHEHPFIDGNKRTAAFAIDFYLAKKKYFLPRSLLLQLLLKYTGPDWTPKKVYRDLRYYMKDFNPRFKP
jgi:Fic family protein